MVASLFKGIKWIVIFVLAVLAVIYFNADAKSLFIRGLMRTGLYKANIKNDRIKLISSNSWELPPSLTFTDSEGREVKLSDKKGKVLFVNFWATWCAPCRAEMPSINSLQNKLSGNKNVEILMVDVDKKLQASVSFMNKRAYNLQVYSPASFIPPEIFDGNLPTTMVVSSDGKVVYHHIGAADYDHPNFFNFISDLSN